MHTGKERLARLPLNDITNLGSIAQQAQREAEARGILLPPPLRLLIGEPGFRTPEHICQAAIEVLQTEPLTDFLWQRQSTRFHLNATTP